MRALLPRRHFYVTIQFHHGFPSIYSNRKAIRGSRCVLEAADVTCGHSGGDTNYHDNANYVDDNQLNRLHSWAALGVVAHHSQVLLTRFPEHWAQMCWCAAAGIDKHRLPNYADANANTEMHGGQTQLQASGGLFVVLGFRTAWSHVSSFVTSQLAASREKTTKSMKRVCVCVFACVCVHACLCASGSIGPYYSLLLPPVTLSASSH